MNDSADAYAALMRDYVLKGEENELAQIESLGAVLVRNAIPLVELSGMHEQALLAIASQGLLNVSSSGNSPLPLEAIRRSSACLGELMIAYSIADAKRQALLERERSLDADRQRLESLGQMAGGVCHEINNLLQPIMGLSELALDDAEPGSDLAKNLAMIVECSAQAASIVSGILTTARKTTLPPRPLAFAPLVSRTVEFLQAILPPGVAIDLSIDCGCESVLCEEAELSQILLNLVRNARHAMDGQGTVAISLTREDTPEDGEAACLHLCIADTGIGMAPDVVARAFHPFFTTRASAGGSGLGLSIVMAIALSWNARLGVQSEPGRGTRISLRLPVCEPPPTPPE